MIPSEKNIRQKEITEFKKYKIDAIKAASDLFYGVKVINKIRAASTYGEVERIMIAARKRAN